MVGVFQLIGFVIATFILAAMNDFNFKWIFGKDLPFIVDILLGWLFNGVQLLAWVLGLVLQGVGFALPLFK